MKKIGLITFHGSNNCGSMLQAFALQKKIYDLGYTSTIINFQAEDNVIVFYNAFIFSKWAF